MNKIIWFKGNLPTAVGNTVTDHISLAKYKIRTGEQVGFLYDDRISFQKDLVECNLYIDFPMPLSETNERFRKDNIFLDPCFGKSWDSLVENKEKANFVIPQYMQNEGRKILSQNGIDVDKDKIISFQAREIGFKYTNVLNDPERYVKIENFVLFAKEMISKGFKIIRLGDRDSASFIEPMDSFFDATVLKNKRLLHDMYFISVSKVCVACDSGMWPTSVALGTPTLHCNSCHGQPNMGTLRHWFPWESGHLTINKHVFFKGKEMDVRNAIMFFNRAMWHNIPNVTELKDNTYQELVSGVEYLLSLHHGKK